MPPAKGKKYAPRQPKPSKGLEDVRWVYANPKAVTEDHARKKLQEEFDKDFNKFFLMMKSMERDFAGQRAGVGPEEPTDTQVSVDAASERIEVLIDELLADLGVTNEPA